VTIESIIRFYALLSVGAIASAAAFGLAWYRTSRRMRALETLLSGQSDTTRIEAELDDMRQRLDGFGENLERVTGGQDFLVRMVSERHPGARSRATEQARAVTPH